MTVTNADTPNLILNETQVNHNCNEILFPATSLAEIERFTNTLGEGVKEPAFCPPTLLGMWVGTFKWSSTEDNLAIFTKIKSAHALDLEFYF